MLGLVAGTRVFICPDRFNEETIMLRRNFLKGLTGFVAAAFGGVCGAVVATRHVQPAPLKDGHLHLEHRFKVDDAKPHLIEMMRSINTINSEPFMGHAAGTLILVNVEWKKKWCARHVPQTKYKADITVYDSEWHIHVRIRKIPAPPELFGRPLYASEPYTHLENYRVVR